jgi:hypothetical protein
VRAANAVTNSVPIVRSANIVPITPRSLRDR